MEPLLNFVRDFWWLIFPVMGVGGGIARRWQIASRERHERRLETLRLKSELKTAELQARALTGPVRTKGAAQPKPAAASVPSDELLERLYGPRTFRPFSL